MRGEGSRGARAIAIRAMRAIGDGGRDLLDALTDRRCPGCDGAVDRGEAVCRRCVGAIGSLGSALCLRCLDRPGDAPGSESGFGPPPSANGGGCPEHGSTHLVLAGPPYEPPLDAVVRAFKYAGNSHLAPWLAGLVPSLAPLGAGAQREALLVPAPLHPARRAARGYDQAFLLAECLGRRWGIPVVPLLERSRDTPPQARLDPASRRSNVREAFRLRADAGSLLHGRFVLLVDDVVTTGATLLAAAEALEAGSPSWVLGLAAAHGGRPGGGGEAAQSTAHARVAAPEGVC